MSKILKPVTSAVFASLLLAGCGGTAPDGEAVNNAADAVATNVESTSEVLTEGADGAWTALEGDWESAIPEITDRWAELSPDDIMAVGGDKNQLVMLLQETYGIDQAEAEQQVSDWAATR